MQDAVQLFRKARIERRDVRHLGIDDAVDQRRLVPGPERQAPGQELEEDDAQRVEVGLLVERVALDLLGRHVGRGADAHDEGRVAVHVLAQVQRQAEIEDLRLVVAGDQDVGWLDVTMDDALPVRIIERHAALENDADDPVQGQQAVDPGMVLEREAVDVLHRQIGIVVLDDALVDLGDVGMGEAAGDHLLVLEQLAQAARHGGTIVAEADQLDRHRQVGIRADAEVDRGGRPLAQFLDDAVLADAVHATEIE